MGKKLPSRPNLDHLRRQAKALLAALASGDADALETVRKHLPSAGKLSPKQVMASGLRLADAQSAIARKTGFASWPQLARHIEQLRALEGTWEFASLEVDGQAMPGAMLSSSHLLIDGDRFRTESPEAIYEGVFNIDVESDPHGIDIEFIEGPEAGNWNYGIFRLSGDTLDLCLDTTGRSRPTAFQTSAGTGHALESLRRASAERPASVTGGTRRAEPPPAVKVDESGFEYAPSAVLARLAGDWSATRIVRDGLELPKAMLTTGLRSATRNEIKITFGGKLMIHALVRINETARFIEVDYCNIGGPFKGALQQGIMKWVGEEACFCMAASGQPRPADFDCPAGSGRILSQWRRQP